MARDINVERYYVATRIRMLDQEVGDYYVGRLTRNRLEDYEPPISEFCLRCAGLFDGDPWCFLDVGANSGIYSLGIAAASPSVHCHAYEPVPRVCEALQSNIALNPELASRITVHPVGVSSVSGEVVIHETVNEYGFLSTSSSMAAPAAAVGRSYPVPVVSIDAEAYDARVRLMKVDVEGYEHDVFAGAKSTILRDRPVIVFEVLDSSKGSEFDALARELNYRYVMFIGDSFQISLSFVAGTTTNYVFCPAEEELFVFSVLHDMGLRLRRRQDTGDTRP